jgi:hypothetical protein
MDDIEAELTKAGVTEGEVSAMLRTKLAMLVERGFNKALASVLSYNRAIKGMAKERLFTGVDDEVVQEVLALAAKRSKRQDKSKDLTRGDMTRYLELGRIVHEQSEFGLNFTAPDGMFVDLRRYIKYSEQYQTTFHGKPTILITDDKALDVQKMLQGAAPAIIHNLDSLILKYAYADAPYEISLVHDSVGVHPNYMEDAAIAYRRGFHRATEPGYLEKIAEQWGCVLPIDISTDVSWRANPDSWVNMFN